MRGCVRSVGRVSLPVAVIWACAVVPVAAQTPPLPPDTTAPLIANQSPAGGATGVDPAGLTVVFCAYDGESGVDTDTLQVTIAGTTYSAILTPGDFLATPDDATSCAGLADGPSNANGVKVAVTPNPALNNETVTLVTPSFSDVEGVAYDGGSYSFRTQDVTAPTRGSELPGIGSTAVDVASDVIFCVYDALSGVDVSSIAVGVDDTVNNDTYSSILTPGNFSTQVNDSYCDHPDGDGSNQYGVKITINPLQDFPNSALVTVTPSFNDVELVSYTGGSYSFTSAEGLPPPPDTTAPVIGNELPVPGGTDVPVTSTVQFCAFDSISGVDSSTIEVTVQGTLYSSDSNPGNFSAVRNASCPKDGEAGVLDGFLVTVTPVADLPSESLITVTPVFTDLESNAYGDGSYTFTTADDTPPSIGTEAPAPGSVAVDVNAPVSFCAYDTGAGVNVSTLSVTVNDTVNNDIYSTGSNPSYFSTSVNDPTCTAGNDGANTFGVKVTVQPKQAFPNSVLVTITPSFSDAGSPSNAYADGSYTFTSADPLPPPPDGTPPVIGDRVPDAGAINVARAATVQFCAYDIVSGVNISSIQVAINDTVNNDTYSAALTPSNFSAVVDASCNSFTNAGGNGVLVTITPLQEFPQSITVVVTPSMTDSASPSNAYSAGPYTFDTEKLEPVVLVSNPAESAIVGGLTLLRVNAYDPSDLHATTPVLVSFNDQWDTNSRIKLDTENPNFGLGGDPARGIYDLFWDTVNGNTPEGGGAAIGGYGTDTDQAVTVYIRVYGTDNEFAQVTRSVQLKNQGGKPVGSGKLLRREPGGDLCRSCHNVKTHSAANLGTKYGTWGMGCWDCHTPHGTPNLMLMRQTIQTPNSGPANVDLRNYDQGLSDYGLVELDDPPGTNGRSAGQGVCEICHTKTKNPDGSPRYRNTGEGANGHPTTDCLACHTHSTGFQGAGQCNACHNAPPLTNAAALNLGPVHGTHDGSGTLPDGYGETALASTAGAYNFPCGKCHPREGAQHMNSSNTGSEADPRAVQIDFDDTVEPKIDVTASYTPGGSSAGEQGPSGDYYKYTNGSCSNIYCHGEFVGGNAGNDPVFQTGTQPCGVCHGASQGTPPSNGSHSLHAGTLAFDCQLCHAGTVDGAPSISNKAVHVNGGTDWQLYSGDTRTSGGTYNGQGSGRKTPPSATYASCDNLYCHSNGSPVGATTYYQQPTWGGAITGGCIGCHGNSSGEIIGQSASLGGSSPHGTHVGTYGFKCDDCHDDTVSTRASDTTLTPGNSTHVDGAPSVKFTTWPADQTGGSWSSGTHTCSNTYCHSNGQSPFGAPLVTADWDGAAMTCESCHDNADASSTGLSSSHHKHTQVGGYAFDCAVCHGQTVTGSTTILDTSRHVDGGPDWYFTNVPRAGNVLQTNGTGTAGSTCDNVYCHSAGNDFIEPFAEQKSIAWGATGTCYNCHGSLASGGRPDYADDANIGGTTKQNSHDKHNFDCNYCHNNVVDPGALPTTIKDATLHVNGTYELQAGGTASFSSVAGSPGTPTTCSTISCHGNGGATWGDAGLPCLSCHTGTEGDVPGEPNAVDDEWSASAHGSAGSGGFGNEARGGCEVCHQLDAAHVPPAATNPYRLRFSATDNTLCLRCHESDLDPGISTDSDGNTLTNGPYNANSPNFDADQHWGAKHSANEGGFLCWDCHDPHGVPSNLFDVKSWVSQESDAYGTPITTVQVTFTDNASDTPCVGCLVENTNNPRRGICQACHAPTGVNGTGATKYWRNDGTDEGPVASSHNIGGGDACVDCHQHPKGFQASCSTCHGAPPPTNDSGLDLGPVHASHTGTDEPTVYGQTTNVSTSTVHKLPCGKCHPSSDANHMNDAVNDGSSGNPWLTEVNGYFDNVDYPKADLLGTASYSQNTINDEAGPGGDQFTYSDGTCSNVYCHGEFPGGDQNNNPTFNTAGNQAACGTCHGASSGTPPSGGAHGTHVGAPYSLPCQYCHKATVNATPAIIDKTKHINGAADWDLLTTEPRVGGSATYTGSAASFRYVTVTPTYGSCANVQCHTDGAGGAPNTTPSWGDTPANACIYCHDNNAAASPNTMASNKHGAHVDNAGVIGTNIQCGSCHGNTVTGDTTISTPANHTNMTVDVGGGDISVYYSSGGQAGECESYCHSSGQTALVRVNRTNQGKWTGAVTLGCDGCHGQDGGFTSQAGEPNYTSGAAGSDTANSHQKHVTGASDCTNCHNATTNNGTSILGTAPHLDGSRDVVIISTYDGDGTGTNNYNTGTKQCADVSCHGYADPGPQWGDTLTCLGCHSGISGEWATRGHGAGGGVNASFSSSNDGCDYCHDVGAAHTPTSGTNPYRLRFSATDNTLCLQCHDLAANNDSGVTVESVNKDDDTATGQVGTAHWGSKHAGSDGGLLCWDCHDPHGAGSNLQMMKTQVSKTRDAYGVPGTTTTVVFTDRTSLPPCAGCFTEGSNNPRQGICQACHDATSYWRSDGTLSSHNSGKLCTDCHSHLGGWAGAGACMDCHNEPQNGRRQIVENGGTGGDFKGRSHHVVGSNPTTQVVEDWDCIVCHAEGRMNAAGDGVEAHDSTQGGYHKDGVVDLVDVDHANNWNGAGNSPTGTVYNWNATDGISAAERAAMDTFCLSCHDSDGALYTYNMNPADTAWHPASPTGSSNSGTVRPFGAADLVMSATDQELRPPTASVGGQTRGTVLDVKTQFDPTGSKLGASTAWTKFSYHALVYFGVSRYDTLPAEAIANNRGFTAGNVCAGGPCDDTSLMYCTDCHRTDFNAHGTVNAEYFLKCYTGASTCADDGSDVVGDVDTDGDAVCFRCHPPSYGSTSGSHAPANGGDYSEAFGTDWAGRVTSSGNLFGIACHTCHGGTTFGAIHGSSETISPKTNLSTYTTKAWRFMNGAAYSEWNPLIDNTTSDTGVPNDDNTRWSGTRTFECFTLGSNPDRSPAYSACTQHKTGGKSATGSPRTLDY